MEPFIPIEYHQTRDFSKKLSATFEFLKQNFKSLFKSLLFIAGPPMLIGSVFAGSLYNDYFNWIGDITRNPENSSLGFEALGTPVLWLEIAGAVFFLLASGIMIISVVYNYMKEYESTKSNVIDVNIIWERVRSTLPSYISTMLLFWLLIIASYALIVGTIFGAGLLSPFLAFITGMGIVFGFIYVAITLSLLFIIRAYENLDFFQSVSRCFYLIRDKWWSTFGLLFVLNLIQSTLASIFLVPWYINFFVSMMHSLEGGPVQETSLFSDVINNLFMTLYFLVSFLLYALPLVAIAFQYFNLVERKEARGLMSRIENFGEPVNAKRTDEHF